MHARTVTTRAELEAVWRLSHDAYVRAGYIQPQADGLLRHHVDLDLTAGGDLSPQTTVYYVLDAANAVAGTVSCTLDSPDGLHTDATFPKETSEVRGECIITGQQLGAVWRIETDGDQPHCVIGTLLDVSCDWAMHNCDVCLFTFNPRHSRLYGRLFGMRELARVDAEHGVGAPSVLLRWDKSAPQPWPKHRHRFFCHGREREWQS